MDIEISAFLLLTEYCHGALPVLQRLEPFLESD